MAVFFWKGKDGGCGGLTDDSGGLGDGKVVTAPGPVRTQRCGVKFDCEGCWKRGDLGVMVLVSPCVDLADMRVE